MYYRNLRVMTVSRYKVSGLIMPRVDAERWKDRAYRDAVYRLVDSGVGGFGVFKGPLETTQQMLADLQQRSGGRLLFGADFEYGLPMRITDGGVAMPRAMALGRTNPLQTKMVAAAISREMRALGVHWNWAPVADINSDPDNPIVNVRAFGERPDVVAQHVSAWIEGCRDEYVLTCVKHAPGHGATATDSHIEMPTISVSAERASRREFIPFRAGIAAGADAVMMGHLLVPFLDKKLPASLSRSVVTGLVRETWGFDGLITPDALDMGAITNRFSSGDAAVRCVMAGCDVVLLPHNPLEAIEALDAAVRSGKITEQRLAASEERWNVARSKYAGAPLPSAIDQPAHALVALQAAQAAIKIEGNPSVFPLTQYSHAAVFALLSDAESVTATQWFQYLAQATEMNVDFGYINAEISDSDLTAMYNNTVQADVVVFALFGSALAYRGHLPAAERFRVVIERLQHGRPTILVCCGSPYGVESLPASATLYTFSDTVPSLAASVFRLSGQAQ